eukprot:188970-Chlamydomonas_euryale.AAC.2
MIRLCDTCETLNPECWSILAAIHLSQPPRPLPKLTSPVPETQHPGSKHQLMPCNLATNASSSPSTLSTYPPQLPRDGALPAAAPRLGGAFHVSSLYELDDAEYGASFSRMDLTR